jgi:hypothetical protein
MTSLNSHANPQAISRSVPRQIPQDRIDATLHRIGTVPFRARFHLRERELSYLDARGPEAIRRHAERFIGDRLAPAEPDKDGQQTPWGAHPVFRAQHATATCCRGCLERNHGITKGHALDEGEQAYVVDVICRWIEIEESSRPAGRTDAGRSDCEHPDSASADGLSTDRESAETASTGIATTGSRAPKQPPLF